MSRRLLNCAAKWAKRCTRPLSSIAREHVGKITSRLHRHDVLDRGGTRTDCCADRLSKPFTGSRTRGAWHVTLGFYHCVESMLPAQSSLVQHCAASGVVAHIAASGVW